MAVAGVGQRLVHVLSFRAMLRGRPSRSAADTAGRMSFTAPSAGKEAAKPWFAGAVSTTPGTGNHLRSGQLSPDEAETMS